MESTPFFFAFFFTFP
ncbi:pheA operon leader peptide PheL [Escherichia coli]|nr:pheA operon leader peptide PheL [Escherichia coli]